MKSIFVFFTLAVSVFCGPIDFLTSFFAKTPKGQPFNPIPGPASKQSRIGVVGAGVGGIYAAYQLKKRGFADITVLESTGRIGGKVRTGEINGQNHIMGALIIRPDRVVYKTLKELGIGESLDVESSIWSNQTAHSSLSQCLHYQISQMGVKNRVIAAVNLIRAVKKFWDKFYDVFGAEQAGLFLEPVDPESFQLFKKPIRQFLMDEGMEEMVPLLTIYFSGFGYGSIDEISCYYLFVYYSKFPVPPMQPLPKVHTDLQKMVQSMIEKEDIEVIMNKNVEFVTSSQEGKLILNINGDETEEFDFLIWNAPLNELPKRTDSLSAEEENVLGSQSTYFVGPNVVEVEGYTPKYPLNIFYDKIVQFDSDVCGDIDTPAIHKGILSPKDYKNYLHGLTPNGKRVITALHYGSGSHVLTEEQLQQKTTEFYKDKFNATITKHHISAILEYFPHWSPENIARGHPWRMHDLQGKYNIWFVGGGLFFESVQHAMEHVDFLLELYDKGE